MKSTSATSSERFLARLLALCVIVAVSESAPAQTPVDPRSMVSPAVPAFSPAPIPAISALNELGHPVWSPDGKYIAYISYGSGFANVWITNVETRQSRQVAPAPQTQSSPTWSPDGKRLLFVADDRGDEISDIFLVDIGASRVRNLTQTPQYAESYAAWSPDGRAIAFSSRQKDAAASEIAVMDADDEGAGDIRFLTRDSPADRTRIISKWSPAGDFVYFDDVAYSYSDADIARVSIHGGAVQTITPPTTEVNYRLADLSPDGKTALVSSDAANGWTNIALLDTRTGKLRKVTDEQAHFIAGGFSPSGEQIVFTRDEPLATHVFLYEIKTGATRQLTQGEGLHELRGANGFLMPRAGGGRYFSRDGQRIVYAFHSGSAPTQLIALRLRDGQQTTLVANTAPKEVSRSFVKPRSIVFKSTDGKFLIPALVWMPPNLKRDGSHPAVVEIHGGPVYQTRPYLYSHIQVLASRGYIVISPNYRGSNNYGRTFQFANRKDLGGGDLSDVEAAADWLVATGYVDAKRVAAFGASYGAYLTLLTLAKHPDKWAAGVALIPFVDYFTLLKSQAPWLKVVLRSLMGDDPIQNAALWHDRSPLTHAHRISSPVLITAGANDPRCPPEQARQMERAIRMRGGHVELKIFDEQGHGPEQVDAFIDEDTMVIRFLDEHLRATAETQHGARR